MAEYKALDFSRFETRLLQLLPPRTEDPSELGSDTIECRLLHHVSLLNPPTYHALSYCWGQVGGKQRILVDGRDVEVTTNLADALRQLRYGTKGCDLLWADALCINQQDLYEKSYQISRMGQIYASAALVIAWLGQVDENLYRSFGPNMWYSSPNMSIWALHPFWARVWIVQEVSRAKVVDVMCGSKSLSWKELVGEANMDKRVNQGNPNYASVTNWLYDSIAPLDKFRSRELSDSFGAQRLSLLQALVETRRSEATDARDIIYALLGITSDGSALIPMPDYIVSVRDLYLQIARRIIAGQQQLAAILLAIRAPYTEGGIPSWFPNWSALGNRTIPPWILKCVEYSKPCVVTNMKMEGDLVLHIPIKKIGQLQGCMGWIGCESQRRPFLIGKMSDNTLIELLFNIFMREWPLKQYSRAVDSKERTMLQKTLGFGFIAGHKVWDTTTLRTRIFDFTRIMLGKHDFKEENNRHGTISRWLKANENTTFNGRSLRTILLSVYYALKPKMSKAEEVDKQKWKAVTQRIKWLEANSMALAFTSPPEPQVKIVHNAAECNDWICIIPNCPLPLVLRVSDFSVFGKRHRGYRLIGEVYSADFAACFKGNFEEHDNDVPWPYIWEVEGQKINADEIDMLV